MYCKKYKKKNNFSPSLKNWTNMPKEHYLVHVDLSVGDSFATSDNHAPTRY